MKTVFKLFAMYRLWSIILQTKTQNINIHSYTLIIYNVKNNFKYFIITCYNPLTCHVLNAVDTENRSVQI